MKALASMINEVGTVCLFIMPGFIASACLKSRKDMDKTRMISSLFNNLSDTIFFSKIFFSYKFYFNVVACLLVFNAVNAQAQVSWAHVYGTSSNDRINSIQ
ncbi:MAG: hypothetical protein A2Y62_08065 [Candidatus Fischerbacteria bacterium RBG_13_37_8]|uniref:Uncharacterized protein n=1 Tax=Candidatus Fischerbacteria bacterium RBG_13_37_8 TaxID=1817863 RepID=A0A1F5V5D3_9BACT|nr:MAG: hypothetical protein A2Y62_08065 [Candidatus Fischerbacteria bacterium RBG_13_37_8]